MDFQAVERGPGAFQEPVTGEQVEAMCRRAFGGDVRAESVIELGLGTYNSTFRVDIGAGRPVILRVAPAPARQFRTERELMRNEYATVPFLAPIMELMPRTLAVDFTHVVIGRDYLFQTLLPGVPAPDGLAAYPRPLWASLYRQLGAITAGIHAVRGSRFGRVAGPTFATWSEAIGAALGDIAADLDAAGLDAADVREVMAAARQDSGILDEITEPRLLHGDLWHANVMIRPGEPEPTICGVLDSDRTCWGDPAFDWAVYRVAQRPGTERDAFWETYGRLPATPGAARRALYYQAHHIGAGRLELHRLEMPGGPATYDELRRILLDLAARTAGGQPAADRQRPRSR
jgi:aminoglycoside phosphotransferase (APT) family kinase protein